MRLDMKTMREITPVFILTHGRPDKQRTASALRKHGFTGPIYYVLDDEDATLPIYRDLFCDAVCVFSKTEWATRFDVCDNFDKRRGVVYARNAVYDLAAQKGYRYFWQFDDDYSGFYIRQSIDEEYASIRVRNFDEVFAQCLQWMQAADLSTMAFSQGGDWIGGGEKLAKQSKQPYYRQGVSIRKAMNTFLCDTERRVRFDGRINEDVNMYVSHGMRGQRIFTVPTIQANQMQTQQNPGGLTDLYLDVGTYVKSFYTVMMAPSCVRIRVMGETHQRIHHHVEWSHAVPVIVPERYRKPSTNTAATPEA